jgi:hypothetical protein
MDGGELVFFGLLTAFFVAISLRSTRRLLQTVRALRGGARTAGECVHIQTVIHNTSRTVLCTIAFTTPDGHRIRFDDYSSVLSEGDRVAVTYDPARPERATIVGPGHWRSLITRVALALGCGLAAVVCAAALGLGTGLL